MLDLLVADVEEDIDALYCDYCVFLFETSPRDMDMYFLNMAELEGKRQSKLIDEGRLQ